MPSHVMSVCARCCFSQNEIPKDMQQHKIIILIVKSIYLKCVILVKGLQNYCFYLYRFKLHVYFIYYRYIVYAKKVQIVRIVNKQLSNIYQLTYGYHTSQESK